MSSYLLLETGDKIYFEDLSGFYLLETGFIVPSRLGYARKASRFPPVYPTDRFPS